MDLKPREECQLKDCTNIGRYTPVIKIYPPDEYGYTGPPAEVRTSLSICITHKNFFVEHTALGFMKQCEDAVEGTGRPVDRTKTTIEMEEIK